MFFEQYQDQCLKTWANKHPMSSLENMATVALGLTGEAGEVADIVKKCYAHGHPYDKAVKEKLVKEVGDIMYYVSLAASSLGIDLEEVAIKNTEKLKARYPNGFNPNRSMNREE